MIFLFIFGFILSSPPAPDSQVCAKDDATMKIAA